LAKQDAAMIMNPVVGRPSTITPIPPTATASHPSTNHNDRIHRDE
jgi:hypothetical protein